ncbi:MAG TPA: hypothetical protein VKT72_16380 [Candidatus Baltobacteraceae bacterium]|nr:hypothetical protein [Candidatus Baltobacteraceae bacterium]
MLEIFNTVAAVGTFVVISATAIAAVIQLRHLRANNQLEGLLDIVARLEDEEQNRWIDEARRQLPTMLADPAYVRSVADRTFDRNVAWLQLGNRNERIGSLLKYRLIPEEPFLDVYCPIVIQTWEVMLPITALMRSTTWGDGIWENFEYMYVRAKAFAERYGHGNYPKGVARAKIPAFQFPTSRKTQDAPTARDIPSILPRGGPRT